jgi:predicted negative regulator of RcsB-dependent stress response
VDLLSEDEQWEALKRWVRTNGLQVLGMVAVLLLAWFGWKWWQGRADEKAVAASVMYDQVLTDFDADRIDAAVAGIEALRTKHPGSAYVSAADLAAARVYVAMNELDKAATHLERVANSAADEKLRPIARLRLARVQASQGQYDKALATLGTADMGEHQSAYLEVRGDVQLAKGDRAAALQDYEASRKLLTENQTGAEGVGELLDLKISDLKAAAP